MYSFFFFPPSFHSFSFFCFFFSVQLSRVFVPLRFGTSRMVVCQGRRPTFFYVTYKNASRRGHSFFKLSASARGVGRARAPARKRGAPRNALDCRWPRRLFKPNNPRGVYLGWCRVECGRLSLIVAVVIIVSHIGLTIVPRTRSVPFVYGKALV